MAMTGDRFRLLVALGVTAAAGVGLLVGEIRQGDEQADRPSTTAAARPTTSPTQLTSPTPPTDAEPVRRDWLKPQPVDAADDRPDLYTDGCQLGDTGDEPPACAYGASAETATATIAMVGDSKSGQWATAMQRLAETRGWRVLIYTKSACAAVAVPIDLFGSEYESCTRFNVKVNEELVAHPVDLILTASSIDAAYVPDDELAPGDDAREVSLDTFVEGEKQAWTTWIEAGNRVASISDTVRPLSHGRGFDVPSCVERNKDYLDACSFDRATGEARSGRPGQLRGIEEMDAVDVTPALFGEEVPDAADAPLAWIDALQVICPGRTCPPTDGRLLIYRDGSHLTDTYVESLTDRIGGVMTALGLP